MNGSKQNFRSSLDKRAPVRVAGAHSALGGYLAQEAGFDAVWSSSFEVSAARCLPDASILSMTEYLEAAANMQKALDVPVIADVDTGYGGEFNIAHMVHEYEAAGITAVCIEDKVFPKLNSFAAGSQELLDIETFAARLMIAKRAQASSDFFLVARTEAFICGSGLDDAVRRCAAYVDAGADAVLVHSKRPENTEIVEFLHRWESRAPVIVVPTTYPDWKAEEAASAGVSAIIYANQGLRASINAMRSTYELMLKFGRSREVEGDIAAVEEIFRLQKMSGWQELVAARPAGTGA